MPKRKPSKTVQIKQLEAKLEEILSLADELLPKMADDDDSSAEESQAEETQVAPDRAIFMISGPIGEHHRKLIGALLDLHYNQNFHDPITLLINSDGGDASVGWALIDVINFIRLPVHTVALGFCCSMAADIFVNGDHRTMGANSTLMIHPHSSGSFGNHHSLMATMRGDMIEHERRINHYIKNSKHKAPEEVTKNLLGVLGGDLYLTPKEALDHGLCDVIAEPDPRKQSAKRSGETAKPKKTTNKTSKATKRS